MTQLTHDQIIAERRKLKYIGYPDTLLTRTFMQLQAQLNNNLIGMQPGWDDSITGFNEAVDIMRGVFRENLRRQSEIDWRSDT